LSATAPATQKLIDIQKYINYFTQPAGSGGIRAKPQDVILATISAAPQPFRVRLANPKLPPAPSVSCPGPRTDPWAVVLDHSCIAPDNQAFFGDPAVRIWQVVDSIQDEARRVETSICDTDYTSALTKIGQAIGGQLGNGCLNSPIENRNNPDCVVED